MQMVKRLKEREKGERKREIERKQIKRNKSERYHQNGKDKFVREKKVWHNQK